MKKRRNTLITTLKNTALGFIVMSALSATPAHAATPADWDGPTVKGPPAGPNRCGPGPDVAHIANKHLDVRYAPLSPAQMLDLYLPAPDASGGPARPLIIAIHGGAFIGCDKYDSQLYPMLKGLERGYAVASINYRLSGEAGWPAQINDVKAAIQYLRANAPRYGIDPDRIALWGGSAGGYLAALAGVTADMKEMEDPRLGAPPVSTAVQAVVDWFGPINFLTMDAQWKEVNIDGQKHSTPDSFESFLLRKQITLIPDIVKAANPETYISAKAPPFFIQHGDRDSVIPSLQSKIFAEKLTQVIGAQNVRFTYLAGAEHAQGALFHTDDNIRAVLDFLDAHLR